MRSRDILRFGRDADSLYDRNKHRCQRRGTNDVQTRWTCPKSPVLRYRGQPKVAAQRQRRSSGAQPKEVGGPLSKLLQETAVLEDRQIQQVHGDCESDY
jgi:hypothetical protein